MSFRDQHNDNVPVSKSREALKTCKGQTCPWYISIYTEALPGEVAVRANKHFDLPSYSLVAVPGVETQALNHNNK